MFVAGIGRDIGEFKRDQGDGKIYTVGTYFYSVDLTEEEYLF